jgi:hypothetical protein
VPLDISSPQVWEHCSVIRSRSQTILQTFPQSTVEQSTLFLFWSITEPPLGTQFLQHSARVQTSSHPSVAMVPGGSAQILSDIIGRKFGGAKKSLVTPSLGPRNLGEGIATTVEERMFKAATATATASNGLNIIAALKLKNACTYLKWTMNSLKTTRDGISIK